MARKKEMSYGEVVRSIEELTALARFKRERLARRLAIRMDDRTAEMLEKLSDTDLDHVVDRMFDHTGEYVEMVLMVKEQDRKFRKFQRDGWVDTPPEQGTE